MNLSEVIRASQTQAFVSFCNRLWCSTPVGEINSKDIYSTEEVRILPVLVSRWTALRIAAQECPVLLPSIITCVPTLATIDGDDYLIHIAIPKDIEWFLETRRKEKRLTNLVMKTFVRETNLDNPDKIQKLQQTDVLNLALNSEAENTVTHAYFLPRFSHVIFYQRKLHFYNDQQQESYQYDVKP
jgi:hypothetical protein